jgi:hypothetical protein
MGPEPTPPVVPDDLSLKTLFQNDIVEVLQEYPSARKNADGIHFAGCKIRVKLKDGSILEGWLNDQDYSVFKRKGVEGGWRGERRM